MPSSNRSHNAKARPPFRKGPPASPTSQGPRFKKPFPRRQVCRFCADKVEYIDFKNVNLLRNFISERGKIVSSRMTNVCTAHQRGLTRAIQLSRNIALLPFSVV